MLSMRIQREMWQFGSAYKTLCISGGKMFEKVRMKATFEIGGGVKVATRMSVFTFQVIYLCTYICPKFYSYF